MTANRPRLSVIAVFGITFWLVAALIASAAPPDLQPPEDRPAGHSLHGEAFNEGPRQSAYLMAGVGDVSFPVTTQSSEAQKFFNQGVGQLHGFWYFEAERSFRQAAALDPQCAMAYWGMAMANVNNRDRARKFIAKAAAEREHASPRERLWIDALQQFYNSTDTSAAKREYVRGLERIVQQLPHDVEPKAFLALQLWNDGRAASDKAAGSPQAVDSLLSEVFSLNPLHPAHHYRIHLWDDENASRALRSAALCGQAAPAIAHMWHMPGHIYSKLHRYADAAWQQEASARVDHARMMRDRVLPDQIHNYAHNSEWLVRNLSHIGRVHDAISLAKNMCDLPRHPKYNLPETKGSANFGARRLVDVLVDYELWEELLALKDTYYAAATTRAVERATRFQALGRAFAATGNSEEAHDELENLTKLLDGERAAGYTQAAKAQTKAESERKGAAETNAAAGVAIKSSRQNIEQIEELLHGLQAHIHLAEGNLKDAVTELNQITAFKNVRKDSVARAYLQAGAKDKAKSLATEFVKETPGELRPLATAIYIAWQCGDKDRAEKQFDELRTLAAYADLDVPVLQRLAPIVASLKLPADWREKPSVPLDVGTRPDLSSLGPFRWQPTPAPTWQLTDGIGHRLSLESYHGTPLVLIFYLGFGCPHCVQQLQAFEPLLADFSAAGIDVVAISSESSFALRQSIARLGARDPYPIPILSDSSYATFKAYRAFDDFEQAPLHATMLIDEEGLVRWQDVSYEPFQDAKFLLAEAKRLLANEKH